VVSLADAKDVADFFRVGMSFFTTCLALLGFLIFHPPVSPLLVAASVFPLFAACRAYNSTTDREEDRLNRKRENPLSSSRTGILLIGGCFALGLGIAAFLSPFAFALASIIVFAGLAYTRFRLNALPYSHLIKNAYGAGIASLAFLFGAGSPLGIPGYLCIVFFIAGSSIIADIRDLPGDLMVGKHTLPSVWGIRTAHVVAGTLHGTFAIMGLLWHLSPFAVLGVAMSVAWGLLLTNHARSAHISMGMGVFASLLWVSI
jgi:4-hydroxybenzoate polyprenyltransferase